MNEEAKKWQTLMFEYRDKYLSAHSSLCAIKEEIPLSPKLPHMAKIKSIVDKALEEII